MTAISGIWSFSGPTVAEAAAMAMLEHQLQYGPHGSEVARLGGAIFGRGLYRLLPEDRYDRQPLIDPTERWMMVGDVRVDNRDELLERLGHRIGTEVADAELLFRAYCRWGDEVFDLLLGDFAVGLWDARDETLTLVRDPAGQRPLHFHSNDSFIAFASMPQGLHAHADIPRQLARKEVSAFVANLPRESSSTFFQGVSRVPPGQLIRIRRGRVEARSYWRLPVHQIYFPKQSDYIDAFREQLDRATKVRLRGAGSRVGAHLSAGLDSGAVASTAAHIMARTGEKVVAFTSAPRAGFNGPTIPGRIGDESEIAAEVVARYPNMEHVIVRTGGASPLDIIGAQAELFQEPVGHPCNFVWWSAVHEEAQARGLSVMLTGEAGNLTISSGGLPMLAEFVRARRWAQWLREARSIVGASASWRGVLAMSFGPWVPAPLWRILLSSFAASGGGRRPQLLHPSLRSGLESRANAAARSGPPNKDDRQTRWELLQQHEPGNFRKGVLAKWGVDERDPTADRRVAEFCLALPAEQLFSGGITRRLARLALADRLPNSVINGVRGYQYPDWYERIDKESLERTLSELEAGPMASLLLDFDELRELVSTWPSEDQWGAIDKIAIYRLDFLMALSAGAFANRVCQ